MFPDDFIIFCKANKTAALSLFWRTIARSQEGAFFKGTDNRQKHDIVDILQRHYQTTLEPI